MARRALGAGGGTVTFALDGVVVPQRLVITISDRSRMNATPGDLLLAADLQGARRLMDGFFTSMAPGGGLTITLDRSLPKGSEPLAVEAVAALALSVAHDVKHDPLREVRAQNQELIGSLGELTMRQEETARLNEELEHTNRGVVALYAELDTKAEELQALNETLSTRIGEAIAEREQVEENLRQSQKMEAVGQLTGGIAHDFNNLLQIVTGNLELLERGLPAEAERLRRFASNAMHGAERAGVLTQRLLAFSRRQPLAPKPIDFNQLVAGMTELIGRTLGETIAMKTVLADNLWLVEADPNQLENALLNLAVNARDAMPDGGKLTIETANTYLDEAYASANADAASGDHVALCVSDGGSGMSRETIARVFEPFFTTKEVGRGTGLGLSMVYGFSRQSGGHVKIYSELGEGTTVKLYLPRLVGKLEVVDAAATPVAPRGRGEEVILVVEDDPGVRDYTTQAARELGYTVLEAADGASALTILSQTVQIDLLFTDVILPAGMSGRDLAEAAGTLRPSLKVLFTTGYARDAIVHNGRLDANVELIGKPFSFAELASRLRKVLDAGSQDMQFRSNG